MVNLVIVKKGYTVECYGKLYNIETSGDSLEMDNLKVYFEGTDVTNRIGVDKVIEYFYDNIQAE